MELLIRCAVALICLCPAVSLAQDAPPVPSSATEAEGFLAEPGLITRAAIFADRHLGKGGLTNGIFVDYGNMIPGAGWASAGPGYRHWYNKDSLFVEGSASISVNGYKMAQGRVELPALLKSRLAVGTQLRWQDFGRVDYFGAGRFTTEEALSNYSIKSAAGDRLRNAAPGSLAGAWRPGWLDESRIPLCGRCAAARTERSTHVRAHGSIDDDRHARFSRASDQRHRAARRRRAL